MGNRVYKLPENEEDQSNGETSSLPDTTKKSRVSKFLRNMNPFKRKPYGREREEEIATSVINIFQFQIVLLAVLYCHFVSNKSVLLDPRGPPLNPDVVAASDDLLLHCSSVM